MRREGGEGRPAEESAVSEAKQKWIRDFVWIASYWIKSFRPGWSEPAVVAGFTLLYVYSLQSARRGWNRVFAGRAVEGRREWEGERGRTGAGCGYRKEGVGNARRRKEVVVRPCGSMKSKATLSPELPPFGNDVFRLPGARGINPICLPPSSRV